MAKFAQLGLPDDLVQTLKKRGFVTPFPIQEMTIPDALKGHDICGKAPTGSGKTLAFGLPAIVRVERAQRGRPEGLILVPTRELAEQIKKALVPLAQAHGRYVSAVFGGVSDRPQKNELRRGVDLLVATPGRLQDLIDQGAVSLENVEVVVIDEADRLADMGFLPDIRKLLDLTPTTRQTLLFSATLDGDVKTLVDQYQRDPVRHEAEIEKTSTGDTRHLFWLVQHPERVGRAADVIKDVGRTIVFTRTRHGADRLGRQLAKLHVDAAVIHGGRSQRQRTNALRAFASGKVAALIATDVAARGIHVDDVGSVVHFDPPADHKDYIHRSGRTARAGADGVVVTLVQPQQRRAVNRMQTELGMEWPIDAPDLSDLRTGPRKASKRPIKHRGKNGANAAAPKTRPARSESKKPTPKNQPAKNQPAKKQTAKNPSTKNQNVDAESVYVANIPWSFREADLTDLFSEHGRVVGSTVIVDKRSGRGKGYGFVDMPKRDAERAIASLNGRRVDGRAIAVRFAKPRTYGG